VLGLYNNRFMMQTNDKMPSGPGQPPEALLAAVRRILRPMVRGFIRFGLTYSLLSEMIKRAYVDIAREEFRLEADKSPSDSRISLLTRVHRKDIRAFRLQPEPATLDLSDLSVSAQIIARWLSVRKYLAPSGQPRALPREGKDGFDQLALSISKDMHPRAILDELMHGKLAKLDVNGQVQLDARALVPDQDFDNLAWYYGLNPHDHIAASTHNISGNKPAFLDRSVHYSGLRRSSVEELQALSRELGMGCLLAINKRASELESDDSGKENADQRMTFGMYFYGDDDG